MENGQLLRTSIIWYLHLTSHVKAVLFGDHATAAQILASNDPAAAKRLVTASKDLNRKYGLRSAMISCCRW